jgi:cholesterol transport system auxiliary component
MKTLLRSLLKPSLLILAVSSCSILPKPPLSAVHDLGFPDSNTPSKNTALSQQPPITVEVPNWLADNRIRYRLLFATPSQVRFYSLDRWIAPPSELFEQLLNNSGKQWPNSVTTIQLQVFEQRFDAPGHAKVIMHFTATHTPTNNKQKLSKRDFYLQQPCPTPDAKGAVSAFALLTRQAVDKIQAWLMETN